ncbi:alpha/beta hydrolase [Adhaeribacter soli]|uniref:Phospholipase n=1 Tax=Adhaeribacter soli TaxID=2607655 RepID=A0A5N1J620_9BACT|nr:phospholipase [Adhaeribacter soli]KAA9340627.1 phospholipase [Adhaeribacter soli]
MKAFNFSVTRTANVYQLGEFSAETETLWVVCHGYGQRADYFLRHFQGLDTGKNVIVAPEGLSRFYREGYSGHVGASWMTKYNREAEIHDYVNYLNQLFESLKPEFPADLKVNILGFSQGGATVCRWLTAGKIPCTRLILWAAAFPEDMNFDFSLEMLKQTNIVMVYGTEDELISKEMPEKQYELLRSYGITPQLVSFTGGHKLDAEILRQLDLGII